MLAKSFSKVAGTLCKHFSSGGGPVIAQNLSLTSLRGVFFQRRRFFFRWYHSTSRKFQFLLIVQEYHVQKRRACNVSF